MGKKKELHLIHSLKSEDNQECYDPLPVPDKERSLNTKLKQNPRW